MGESKNEIYLLSFDSYFSSLFCGYFLFGYTFLVNMEATEPKKESLRVSFLTYLFPCVFLTMTLF